jgi:hypothetical protein
LLKLEKSIKDNLHLRNELNDARHQLITRDNFIKDLQQQLADPAFRKTTANELKVCFCLNKNNFTKTV